MSSFQLKDLKVLPEKITPEVGIGLGAGTLADCIITGTLVYYLRKHKSGFNKCVAVSAMVPDILLTSVCCCSRYVLCSEIVHLHPAHRAGY